MKTTIACISSIHIVQSKKVNKYLSVDFYSKLIRVKYLVQKKKKCLRKNSVTHA